jgi:hypothetical protein
VNKKVLIISSLFVSAGIFCAAQDSNSNAVSSEVKTPVAVSVEQPKAVDKPEAVSANDKITAEGTISDIAADGSSISVDTGKETVKFLTTKDFIDEAYMETGDKVKIVGEKTDAGVKLVDYDYVFDEAYETGEGEPEPAAKIKSATEEPSMPQPEAVTAPAAPAPAPASEIVPMAGNGAPAAEPSAPADVIQDVSSNAPATTGNSAQ